MSNLSFSLSQYDAAMTRLVREVKAGVDKTDPILGQIQTSPVAHDGTTRQVSAPKVVDTQMKDFSVEVVIQLDWYRETDVEQLAGFLWELSESLNSQSKKYMFEVLTQTTEAVGNSFDLKGRNIWDALNEMTESTEIRFDENGDHHYQFYIPVALRKRLEENPPTPEQFQRWQEIINTKRVEYYAKKRTRRLS